MIGGVAVIARGVPRFTADIDVAIKSTNDSNAILALLAKFGLLARIPDAARFAEENLVILVRHEETGVDVDVSLSHLDFEDEAIAKAEPLPFGRAIIPVPRATDLVIYKMVAARPKDVADVEALVVGGADIDADRVGKVLLEFDSLLDFGRAEEWQALARRLAGPPK